MLKDKATIKTQLHPHNALNIIYFLSLVQDWMQPHPGFYLRRSLESQGVLSAPYVPMEDILINFICSSCLPTFQVKLHKLLDWVWELGSRNSILLGWEMVGFVHKKL